MACECGISKMPVPYFDESTGYILLCDGANRQVVCRLDGDRIYLWWKKGHCEVPVDRKTWDSFFA